MFEPGAVVPAAPSSPKPETTTPVSVDRDDLTSYFSPELDGVSANVSVLPFEKLHDPGIALICKLT